MSAHAHQYAVEALADHYRSRLWEARLGKDPYPGEPWSLRVSDHDQSRWLHVTFAQRIDYLSNKYP